MAARLRLMSLPGTRSAETVRDDGQTDFLSRLWTAVTRVPESAPPPGGVLAEDDLPLSSGTLRVRYVRHARARRYRLLFRRDGTARCTVPRRGTLRAARRFVASNEAWLAERMRRHQAVPRTDGPLTPGQRVALYGREYPVEADPAQAQGRLGPLEFPVAADGDLRRALELALRRQAGLELPQRTRTLAARHGLEDRLSRISVRNQQTRWGSCSARGVLSLNWRLIQAPPEVCDYVILHELAHLVHLNHGPRFWELVAAMCPQYRNAEDWLKRSGRALL